MADGLNIQDTTYAGTAEVGFMITPSTFGLDTLRKNCAYVKDGIKKTHNIPKIDIQKILQPRAATPTSQGTFTVTKQILNPQDVMAYIEFNPRDWEDHFYAEQLSRTLLARELPVTAENVMMQLFLNRAFEQIEVGLHMGSQGYTTNDPNNPNFQIKYWDGFIRKALVDGTYIPSGTPSAITTANIVGKFQEGYSLLPKAILADPYRYEKVKIMVSTVDRLKYEDYQANIQTYKGVDTTQQGINRYKGYDVVDLAGLPENTFYMGKAYPALDNNMFIGMNSTDDMMLQLQRLQNNSEYFFFKMLAKIDVNVAKFNELFMHTTLTTSTFTQ